MRRPALRPFTLLLFSFLASLMLPTTALAQLAPTPPSFAASFKAGALTVNLIQGDGQYSGTLRIRDLEYPIHATVDGETLKGTFDADGSSFEFTARFDDDILLLESDGVTHRLSPAARNPLAKEPEPRRQNPLAEPAQSTRPPDEEPAASLPDGPAQDPDLPQRRPHIVGITVSTPSDWQVQEANGTMLMIPSDAPRGASGPNEAYVLVYAVTQAASAHDQSLLDKLSGEFRQLGAALAPDGEIEKFRSPLGPAARIAFAGTTDEGTRLKVAADVVIRDGLVVGILAIGEANAVVSRKDLARKVFNALRPSEVGRDAAVAGTWRRSRSYSDSISGFSMATETKITLDPSGSYEQSSQAIGGDANNGIESQGEPTRGLWFAKDGVFILLSHDGDTTQGSYRIVDGSLVTTPSGGSRQIWDR
jgi:hypothetical protein